MSKLPLEGIRVLDFTRYASGPICSQIMGDLGAEIWKIEAPGVGDVGRTGTPFKNGEAAYFHSYNRSKKSITLDTRTPEAQEIIKKMIPMCDVFLDNSAPGFMEKIGFDYESVRKLNPKIIYTAITGFGLTGDSPYKKQAAMDPVIQARSGLMAHTGFGDAPVKAGPAIADLISGYYACMGTLTALYERTNSGEGQMVDIAMMDAMFASLDSIVVGYGFSGKVPPRMGNRVTMLGATGSYPTKDGKAVMITCASDKLAFTFAKCAGQDWMLEDPRFQGNAARSQNQDWIDEQLVPWTKTKTREELVEIMQANGVPCCVINDIGDNWNDPHFKARDMLVTLPHPIAGEITMAGQPIKLSRTPAQLKTAGPVLGANNEEILGGVMGISAEELAALKEKGVI